MPDFPHGTPDPANYAVFKGNVYFTEDGGSRRHVGNVAGFTLTPAVERLEHFSNMSGLRTRDRNVPIQTTVTLSFIIEEMTLENFKMAMMGVAGEEDTDGNQVLLMMADIERRGRLEFIGNGAVGPKWNFDFESVSITPEDAQEFLSEDAAWSQITVSAEVEAQTAGDGTVYYYKATLQDSQLTEPATV